MNLDFATRHPETHPFVAEVDGGIVGTGVLSVNGSVGWIGTIWVEPAWRRRGVGMALTQATIETAESAGCRTLLLVATEAGRLLYEKIGFEVQTWYRMLEAPGLGDEPVDPRIRAVRGRRPPSMAELSAGRDRRGPCAPARAFASPRPDLCPIRDDGALGGFVVRHRGAVLDDRATHRGCRAILHARRVGRGAEAQSPRRAPRGERGRARTAARRPAGPNPGRAPRLIRGEPLDWQPEAIWGQFNHALG